MRQRGVLAVLFVSLLPLAAMGEEKRAESLVLQYLLAPDDRASEEILRRIVDDKGISVEMAEKILRRGRRYKQEPTGSQPGLTLSVDNAVMTYALYVPEGYDPGKSYPLVVCLHGAGFNGDAYLDRWVPRLGEKYMLACPTLERGFWWTRKGERLVMAVLDDVVRRYHVDRDRIFLTGMSNGGIGTYFIGAHHADRFSAVAPMAGGFPDGLFPLLENFRETPVYIIHGSKDQVMPVELSQKVSRRLIELGYNVVYREHDREHPVAGGHFFPREELPDLIKWLDRQKKDPLPKKFVSLRDRGHVERFAWAKIEEVSEGIGSISDNLEEEELRQIRFARLGIEIVGPNRVEVTTENVKRYTLFLNERLVNLEKPITVITNKAVSFEGRVKKSLEGLLREARIRRDQETTFPASLTIEVKTD